MLQAFPCAQVQVRLAVQLSNHLGLQDLDGSACVAASGGLKLRAALGILRGFEWLLAVVGPVFLVGLVPSSLPLK